MRSMSLKGLTVAAAVVFTIMGAAVTESSAQNRRISERERQRIERLERQRQQNRRSRDNDRYGNDRYDNDRYGNNGRIYDNRSNRGGNSNAVNMGYQQGLIAGQYDRRKKKYNQSNVYRNTGSYPNQGDPSSADYAYRQGYLQGYNDGYNGTRRY